MLLVVKCVNESKELVLYLCSAILKEDSELYMKTIAHIIFDLINFAVW